MNETTLQYIDPFSILLIDLDGILKRLLCPFKVVSVLPDALKEDQLGEMVRKNPDNAILYVIAGQVFPHSAYIIR